MSRVFPSVQSKDNFLVFPVIEDSALKLSEDCIDVPIDKYLVESVDNIVVYSGIETDEVSNNSV